MGEYNRYITGSAVAEGGGMTVLQEAGIRSSKNNETAVILMLVFAERGDRQWELSRAVGEWFQNSLVPMIKKEGTQSLINVCIEGIGRRDFNEQINKCEYACVIVAGDSCALFANGDEPGMYTVEELLGKTVMIPMKAGSDGIMVELEEGGAIVITDKKLDSDDFYTKELAAGMSAVYDEKALERLLGEVVNIKEAGCRAIAGIRVMD